MEDRATIRDQSSHPPSPGATLRDFRNPINPTRRTLRRVAGYEILEELGHGGMGVVYKARQVQLDRLVALKMLRAAGRDDLVRFRVEAEAVARLVHPNIVQIYEVGQHDGQPFFSLEYVDGGTLADAVASIPDAITAARLVVQLARAVQHAHEHGIVHRDLKPANVLIQQPTTKHTKHTKEEPEQDPSCVSCVSWLSSSLKITDFGLAKNLHRDSSHTRAGEVLGTPSYMAPEQAEGRLDVGPACDVWALGAILYECLTGQPPFLGESVVETLDQVRHQEPPSPRTLTPTVPRDLAVIALKCLEKTPARRYPSAAALADDLERFLDGRPIQARPLRRIERLVKWARRHPTAAALVGVCAVFLLVLAAAAPVYIHQLHQQVRAKTAEIQDARREALRQSCASKVAEGKLALTLGTLLEAERALVEFATVQESIVATDLGDARLAALHREAAALRQQAQTQVDRLLGGEQAATRARQFLTLRDEAFFQLNHDLVGLLDRSHPVACLAACRRALDAYPRLDCLPDADQARLRQARVEVLLMTAEATSRLDAPGHLQDALRLLDQIDDGPRHGLHLRRARYLQLLGQSEAAARAREQAEQTPPKEALDWFLRGQERFHAGATKAAVADLTAALDLDHELYWARLLRAIGLQRLGQASEARDELGACIRARPESPWPYLLRAHLSRAAKDHDASDRDLAAAAKLRLDTTARYALLNQRGVLALARKQPHDAVRELQYAALLLPQHQHAHANLSQAYWDAGDRDRALASIDYAVSLNTTHADLRRTHAGMLIDHGRLADALRELDHLLDRGADPKRGLDLREKARVLYSLRRYADALPVCKEARAAAPNDPAALRLEAEVLLELGRHRESLAAFDEYIRKAKPQVEAYRRRAKARAGTGDLIGVVNDWTQVIDLAPADPAGHVGRGWANLVAGCPKPALGDFQKALDLDAGHAEALIGRGTTRLDLGDLKQAVADLEAGVKAGPTSARVLYSAARGLARVSQLSPRPARDLRGRAVEVLRQALAALPPADRPRFLRETVRKDDAFRPFDLRGDLDALDPR